MKRALVLAGGGAKGSYQVGVWKALAELGWKQADLCRRIDKDKNTVSKWATHEPPLWVSEYLGAMLAIDRIHRQFVRPLRPADLADPDLLTESRSALDELTTILNLGTDFYPFQRG